MQTIIDKEKENEIKSTLSRFALSIFSEGADRALFDEVNKLISQMIGRENVPNKEKMDYLTKTLRTMGLDTKVQLAESVGNDYRSMAMDFADQLIAEYDCKTSSEKALAQVTANAFVRTLEYSNTMETCRDKTVKLDLFGFYSIIGKELDRANRHFLSSLMTLRQMKLPAFKINVTANTAFVAENQQVNINKD
jgi:hypothetical protein